MHTRYAHLVVPALPADILQRQHAFTDVIIPLEDVTIPQLDVQSRLFHRQSQVELETPVPRCDALLRPGVIHPP